MKLRVARRIDGSRVPTAVALTICVLGVGASCAAAANQKFEAQGEQRYTVPPGVFIVHVLAVGGRGASAGRGGAGGAAAQVNGDLAVTPAEVLYIEVGGPGEESAGGFNGGGSGAGGGGGATDVRTSPRAAGLSPEDRLIVAGGGGGGGSDDAQPIGRGGSAGEDGEEGGGTGGGAGSQTSGGREGPNGCGSFGGEGQRGVGGYSGGCEFRGGGGGGGYFGGGGGGGNNFVGGGGGGGGSSLVPAGGSVSLALPEAPPQVQISYTAGPLPTVTAVKPIKGAAAGGATVTITGTNFTQATQVKFGTVNASSSTVVSATEIRAISPPESAGTVDVVVATPGNASPETSADHYKFGPPTITAMSPNGGTTQGGTSIAVTGSGFVPGTNATAFKFGARHSSSVSCTSSTRCTVIAPAHPAGIVHVKATVASTTSPSTTASGYTYN